MNTSVPDDDGTLRRRAEAQLALRDLPTKLALRDPIRMLHELQVHQIELEMQNEQLAAASRESEAQRTKFQTLYELAPIAILTVSVAGRILEFNERALKLLGETERGQMRQRSLLDYVREDRLEKLSGLLHRAFEQGSAMEDDLALTGVRPLPAYVQVQAHALKPGDGSPPVLLVAMMDVTALRQIRADVATMITREDDRRRPPPAPPDQSGGA
jgi:PAS domain S-box-containing protein